MRFFLLTALTVIALASTAIRVVHERNQSVQLGFSIAEQTKAFRALEEEIHQLRIDRAALLDPKHLAPIAIGAGLHVATPDEVVSVSTGGDLGP